MSHEHSTQRGPEAEGYASQLEIPVAFTHRGRVIAEVNESNEGGSLRLLRRDGSPWLSAFNGRLLFINPAGHVVAELLCVESDADCGALEISTAKGLPAVRLQAWGEGGAVHVFAGEPEEDSRFSEEDAADGVSIYGAQGSGSIVVNAGGDMLWIGRER